MSRKAYFNDAAISWDKKFLTPELTSFLKELVPRFNLEEGQDVLDLGTGTGLLIPYLTAVVGPSGSVTAVDYAEGMIEVCRTKYSHLKNVRIVLQDVEDLDLPLESFDATICFGLFPHLEKRDKALLLVNQVMKPEGKLIIAHALSSAEIMAHHENKSQAVIADELPAETEMMWLLRDAGFTVIFIEDEPGCYLCLAEKIRC
jgi:ubiquinone/menaquinone biosynthesis C-methylase UbiE